MPQTHNLSNVDLRGALTLTVGWKSGAKLKLGTLLVGAEVESVLRSIVEDARGEIERRTPEPWAPDADLSQETYLVLPQSDLGDAPDLANDHGTASLAEVLLAAEQLDTLSPRDLPTADMQFYAITIGSTPGQRAVFLRRINPRRGLRGGKILTSYHDVLARIEDPVFAFDELTDLIFFDDELLILSQSVFVAIFRAQQTLMAQIPSWAAELASHLPITTDGQERLSAKSIRDSRMRTRLEAIVKRGHLADVPTPVIREKMLELGLDHERLLTEDGALVLDEADIPIVLQFLNEDLFPGALTGVGFRADKKAAR